MVRLIETPQGRLEALPRTLPGRMSSVGRKVRRIMTTASVTAELFPPVVLVSALALYFYIVACMGGGDGPRP